MICNRALTEAFDASHGLGSDQINKVSHCCPLAFSFDSEQIRYFDRVFNLSMYFCSVACTYPEVNCGLL